MKREIVVDNTAQIKVNKELRGRYVSPLIKWYDTTMTRSERFRYGLMSYDEFIAWQQELAAKQEAKAAQEAIEAQRKADNPDGYSYSTFWANDEGDRENISREDYAAFLAENNISL